jgi:hypothetical protein
MSTTPQLDPQNFKKLRLNSKSELTANAPQAPTAEMPLVLRDAAAIIPQGQEVEIHPQYVGGLKIDVAAANEKEVLAKLKQAFNGGTSPLFKEFHVRDETPLIINTNLRENRQPPTSKPDTHTLRITLIGIDEKFKNAGGIDAVLEKQLEVLKEQNLFPVASVNQFLSEVPVGPRHIERGVSAPMA